MAVMKERSTLKKKKATSNEPVQVTDSQWHLALFFRWTTFRTSMAPTSRGTSFCVSNFEHSLTFSTFFFYGIRTSFLLSVKQTDINSN